MSKNKVRLSDPAPSGVAGYGIAYVLTEGTPEYIVGRLMGIIELAGLTEKQEKSAKDLIKGMIYELFRDEAIVISSERHTKIREDYYKAIEMANKEYGGNGLAPIGLVI